MSEDLEEGLEKEINIIDLALSNMIEIECPDCGGVV